MVLLDNIVEILHLPDDDRRAVRLIVARMAATLVSCPSEVTGGQRFSCGCTLPAFPSIGLVSGPLLDGTICRFTSRCCWYTCCLLTMAACIGLE
jgi:hypothetical protein